MIVPGFLSSSAPTIAGGPHSSHGMLTLCRFGADPIRSVFLSFCVLPVPERRRSPAGAHDLTGAGRVERQFGVGPSPRFVVVGRSVRLFVPFRGRRRQRDRIPFALRVFRFRPSVSALRRPSPSVAIVPSQGRRSQCDRTRVRSRRTSYPRRVSQYAMLGLTSINLLGVSPIVL